MGTKTDYTQTQLRERGWTVAAINRFLGEPDRVGGSSSRTYYIYGEARVHEAEQTEEYRAWQAESAARKARSKATAERRREQLMQSLDDWEPHFDVEDDVTLHHVIGEAIKSYNDYQSATRYEPNRANRESDWRFLHRITVNYLRHSVTDCDDMLGSLYGKVGVRDAEALVRERVYDAIAERFPELATECSRQLSARFAA